MRRPQSVKKFPICFEVYSVASKQVEDFTKFLWPFQKTWTLLLLRWDRHHKIFWKIVAFNHNQATALYPHGSSFKVIWPPKLDSYPIQLLTCLSFPPPLPSSSYLSSGSLMEISATQLGAEAIKNTLNKVKLPPSAVEDVMMGLVHLWSFIVTIMVISQHNLSRNHLCWKIYKDKPWHSSPIH